jgi:hypothetical protein
MTRILHMSDLHSDAASMVRANNLAMSCPDSSIVALTGDCVDLREKIKELPRDWYKWPQKYKLSVPGNHDLKSSQIFSKLTEWRHAPPWYMVIDDLLFIGVRWASNSDDGVTLKGITEYIKSISADVIRCSTGIVLMCHKMVDDQFAAFLKLLGPGKKMLILCGHDHARAKWYKPCNERPFYQSCVCSLIRPHEGYSHFIQYSNGEFSCDPVNSAKMLRMVLSKPTN